MTVITGGNSIHKHVVTRENKMLGPLSCRVELHSGIVI